MSAPRGLRTATAVALAAALAVGALWSWRHAGVLPHYGDTLEYFALAEDPVADPYRGALYPALLAWLDPWGAGPGFLESTREQPRDPRNFALWDAPPRLARVQALQWLACLAALAYALTGLGDRAGSAVATPLGRGLVCALILLDPLVAHFNGSVMTDSLALSTSWVFCAALARLGRGATPWLPLLVLAGAFAAGAGLRPEKRWVFAGTLALTAVAWILHGSRLRRRAALAGVAVAIGFVAVGVAPGSTGDAPGRWPLREAVLHHRVVFPHLAGVYRQLPAEARAALTLRDAERYDTSALNIQPVIERAALGDPARRAALTRQLARTVWEERAGSVALRIARDALENLFASASFYLRVAAWHAGGSGEQAFFHRYQAVPWTYHVLSMHHPRLSGVFVSTFAVLFALAAATAAFAARSLARERLRPEAWLPGLPFAAFWLVNAAAFAATFGAHPRYALFSHTATLLVVYAGMLQVLWPRPGRRGAERPVPRP